MLQAENEEEYHEWIRALRSQTETLLVSVRAVQPVSGAVAKRSA
jgi:hypothetical protein